MKIRQMMELEGGWRRFDLNVGGFTMRGCRWHVPTRRILFPQRYSRFGGRHQVVFVYGRQVKRLRVLLESGEAAAPRDRRRCTLRVRLVGVSGEILRWIIFNFTVRGFTILGCRWQPESGSIQLPVTYGRYGGNLINQPHIGAKQNRWVKKPVVCAYGAHINRLRVALEVEHQRLIDAEALAA
jgi:hypothetical protein